MVDLKSLLDEAREAGCEIELEAGGIRAKGPTAWLDRLSPHKDQLLALLSGEPGELEGEIAPEDLQPEGDLAGPFPKVNPPGLISRVMDYTLETSPRHRVRALALAGAIALMGAVTGRKLRSETDIRTNLILIATAPSGVGKNHARKVNNLLLTAAGMGAVMGPETLVSSAGFVTQLAGNPVKLFQLDEFHALLAQTQGRQAGAHLANIPEMIKQVFSSADTTWRPTAYADSRKNVEIDQPHAVIYATCTTSGLWSAMTESLISDGFLPRALIFEPLRVRAKDAPAEFREPPEEIVEEIATWRDWAPSGRNLNGITSAMMVRMTPDAKQRWVAYGDAVSERHEGDTAVQAALWSRAPFKAVQLALVLAASRKGPSDGLEVNCADLDRAITLVNWSTRRIIDRMRQAASGQRLFTQQIDWLVSKHTTKWQTQSQLKNRTWRVFNLEELNKLNAHLLDSGIVERKVVGRTTYWRLTTSKGLD